MRKIFVGLSRTKLLAVLAVAISCWLLPLPASAAPALQTATPPPNDNFANAVVMNSLPFGVRGLGVTAATVEAGEPTSPCAGNAGSQQTVWYRFVSLADVTATVSASGSNDGVHEFVWTVYEGAELASLKYQACGGPYSFNSGFPFKAGKTYYLQFGSYYGMGGTLSLFVRPAPPPTVRIYLDPSAPSTHDTVTFSADLFDPAGFIFTSIIWDLGDGTSAEGYTVTHNYSREGEYNVTLTATTYDGRSGSPSQLISVENHDVVITKFTTPQSARSGQVRTISAGVISKVHDERVHVVLYKSAPNTYDGFEYAGELTQLVPIRSNTQATMFDFTYQFTSVDAQMGKVTFKALAEIEGGKADLTPANNTAISLPTKVSGASATVAGTGTATIVENGMLFLPVIISN